MKIPCICPPTKAGEVRHADGDRIELRERLDFRSALAARNAITVLKTQDPDASLADVLAVLTEAYLLGGVESWTVRDEKGQPVEVTKPAIREYLLTNVDVAMEVGEAADELYAEAVMAPLVARALKSSQPSSTDDSTSATTGSESEPLKPSKPSSITTIPMADTEKTRSSPVGASN